MRLSMNEIKNFGLLLTGMLIFSFVFSPTPALAQSGTLEITCVGPSGAPEKDVKVTVMSIMDIKGKDKKSNATGVAVFDKLNNGAYRVVGRKNGFAPALYEFAVVNNGAASATLNLAVGADRKFYFEDPTIERQANMLLSQGLSAIEAGNAAGAEELLAQAIEIKPSAPDVLYYYGLAQTGLGKFDQALESLKKAADAANLMLSDMPKTKPGGPVGGPQAIYEGISQRASQQIALIPVMKAEAAYGAKRFDEAVALYDEAIKSNPQNPVLYSNKALALTQAGKPEEALAAVNKALELNPSDERAGQVKKVVDSLIENTSREKANALITEGNKLLESDASAALGKFMEANTLTGEKQAVIWRQVGRAQAKLKQGTEAVVAFNKAIELAPADQLESYQMSLAQYYLDAKQPEEALDVVVSGSKNPEQRLMDLFTKTKNNPDSAAFSLAALERVVKLNPANMEAVFELGQVYYLDRKDSQAQELLTRYVDNNKDGAKVQRAKDLLTVIANRNKNK